MAGRSSHRRRYRFVLISSKRPGLWSRQGPVAEGPCKTSQIKCANQKPMRRDGSSSHTACGVAARRCWRLACHRPTPHQQTLERKIDLPAEFAVEPPDLLRVRKGAVASLSGEFVLNLDRLVERGGKGELLDQTHSLLDRS